MRVGLARIAILALIVAVASACGSGDDNKTNAPTQTTAATPPGASAPVSSPAAATTTTGAATKALASACTLATGAQLSAVLGAAPSDPAGKPLDYEDNYKTCSWNATPPGAANSNSVRLAVVVKTKPTDKGFSAPTQLGNPKAISGLGDEATLYSAGNTGGFAEYLINANKGDVSASIDANYGGANPDEAQVQAALSDVIRNVFSEVSS
jgi:hypothetical protein